MRIRTGVLAAAFLLAPTAALAQTSGPQWYGGFSGGLNVANDIDFFSGALSADIDTEFDTGYALSGVVGADFGDVWEYGGIRVEAELAYRSNDVDVHKTGGTALAGSDGDVTALSGMVNVLHDFLPGADIRPYVGLGLGFAQISYNDFGVTAIPAVLDDEDTVLAYQAIAGASYALSPTLALTGDYRYFAVDDPEVTLSAGAGGNTTDIEYDSHTFMVGLRYSF